MVEDKRQLTQALIESIGKEKGIVDEAVESSRADEEAAAALSVSSLLIPPVLHNVSHPFCSIERRRYSVFKI